MKMPDLSQTNLFWIPIDSLTYDGVLPFNLLEQPCFSAFRLCHIDNANKTLIQQCAAKSKTPGYIIMERQNELAIIETREYMAEGQIGRATIFNATLSDKVGIRVQTTGVINKTPCICYWANHYPDRSANIQYVHYKPESLVSGEDYHQFCNEGSQQCY